MRFRQITILIRLVFFLLLVPRALPASERLHLDGYEKIIAAGYTRAGYNGEDFYWSNDIRSRINAGLLLTGWLKCNLSYGLTLRLQDKALFQPDLAMMFTSQNVYRAHDLDSFLYPGDSSNADNGALLQNLDRLLITFSAPKFDLFLGRQAIAWGSAHAINPTDVIAPYLYNEIDTEDRIGVDAARIRIPAGSLGEIDAGYVAGKDFESSQSAAFLRAKFYAAQTDVTVLLAGFRDNTLVGIDAARAVGGAGTWLEAAYVFVDGLRHRCGREERMDYLRASAGLDYNFARGIYTFFEYHYNGAGSGDPGRYLAALETVPYREGAVYLLGRHYVIPGVSVQITPLVTAFAEALVNISDSSVLIAPAMEYNLSENFYLGAGAYAGLGKDSGTTLASIYYGSGGPFAGSDDIVIPLYRSEFGAYPGVYYLSLRFYF